MRNKLEQIKNTLKNGFITESEDKDGVEDIDLEKELNYPNNDKDTYTKQIIAVINKMIEGTATIEDLEKIIKSKKKNGK
jgi:hypothetical protein